ncbi:TrkH family potassium uptake protein [Agrilactobacillus fermenti]|uniref:TrkH family potassium uptake protein n=1 Tax=Agrilactobacillus fermenti TaxID=2586909 RepID=UPI001E647AED|nr:potassium transporter TrkG [Agrilactobacillus fermenti]MCD2256873.1 Trk family potassium uptake protein [Agrilactobacillus fermenti]
MKKLPLHLFKTLPQKMTSGFIVIILLGTLLLKLPMATVIHGSTSWLNALFTATSATCITGLTVVNTATHWTIFGQSIILLMSEVGALGYMTFAVLLFNLIKRNLDLSTQLLVKESLNLENLTDTKSVMSYVVSLSAIMQGAGWLLFAVDFIPRYGWRRGVYCALYQSVMSFCNAGFDVFGNSLKNFQNDPYVLLVTIILIIAGGLGFLVWRDVLLYRERRRLNLNSKLTLVTTFSLFTISFLTLLITEKNLAIIQTTSDNFNRLMNTLLLSVTPRTAGLITVNTNQLQEGSIFLIMILMFIGGTPGSTAGGIKTTTFGILVLQSIAQLRGQKDVMFAKRRFSADNINRALLLIFMATGIISIATLILTQTEVTPKEFGLEYILFEVLSAFGTVGLSLGLTAKLSIVGKIVIMLLMFIGRVGIFTSMYAILNQQTKTNLIRYPEENVLIG